MAKWLSSSLVLQLLIIGFAFGQSTGYASDNPSVLYMANEGFMVESGETKVVFDPLFRNGFGHYQLLPKSMEEALFAGAPAKNFQRRKPGCQANGERGEYDMERNGERKLHAR